MENCIKKKEGEAENALTDNEIQRLFKEFDADSDGNISPVELERALNKLGIYPSSLELNAMFLAADRNKDGHINAVASESKNVLQSLEFKDLVLNYPALSSLRQAFRQFDLDRDGSITVDELQKVITQLGQKATEAEIQAMFSAADVDNDQKISFSECAQMMRGRPLVLNLLEIFRQFDIDNDGFVTESEFRVVCRELNVPATEREINIMFLVADENDDGKIAFEEFSRLLMKCKLQMP